MRNNFVMLSVILAAGMVRGQQPVPPELAPSVEHWLQPSAGDRNLACEIRPIAPALTYHMVYRAGYSIAVSGEQFGGREEPVAILMRITPKLAGARPVLLGDKASPPKGAGLQGKDASKFEARIGGGFYLGEGEYHAELTLYTRDERVCRKQWDMEVKRDKAVAARLAAGQVVALSELGWPLLGARPGTLAVLLHAGSARLNPMLIETLAGIVQRMPVRQVEVVAFSLNQHKELFRENVVDSAGFYRVAEAMREFNSQVVDYGVLKDPAGHRDFLWNLLAKEETRKTPPDAAIFVGFSTFDDRHVFAPPSCAESGHKTAYVYLDFPPPRERSSRRPRMPMEPRGYERSIGGGPLDGPGYELVREWPDAISRVTRACSGKVFYVGSPVGLAAALSKTEELISSRTLSAPAPQPTPDRPLK